MLVRPARFQVAVLLALAGANGCDGSSPAAPGPPIGGDPIPSGPALPSGLAAVTTTLDFGDPPFSGRLRITPTEEAPDLRYAVDLDGDGLTDEMGPLGHGVALTYRYETPGPREIGIAVRAGNEWFRADRIVVVNDPDAIRVSDSVRFFDVPDQFSGIALDDGRSILYVATPGLEHREILALSSNDLTVLWRLTLSASAADPSTGWPTGLALDGDGDVLYVDTGDSIEALSVAGIPTSLGVVGPGDAGSSLILGENGTLHSGGASGIARIDVSSGRVLARREASIGGSLSLSPSGDRIAYLESTFLCRLVLLEADDLRPLWSVENLMPRGADCLLVAFSPRKDVLYVIARGDAWHLVVVDGESGEVLRRMSLAEAARGSRQPPVSSPSATAGDGRYVAFSTETGMFIIDAETHLPAFAFRAVTDDRAIGCCNVVSTETGLYTAGWSTVTRFSFP